MKTDCSRRNFIGGAAMLGAVSAASLLAGCAPKKSGDTATGSAGNDAEHYDVVIIGSGLAGLTAGIRSLENGKKSVLIVEKADQLALSSNSCFSGGAFCEPNDESAESVQAFIDEWNKKSKNKGDADITELIANNITADIQWLVDHGCEFIDPVPHTPYNCLKLYAAPGASQGMGPLLQTLVGKFEELGGTSLVKTKLIDFVVGNDGGVSGVTVRGSKGMQTITADATILAAGGYIANRQLREEFIGADADEIMIRGNKAITGDGILAAVRCGAMMYEMGGAQSLHVGAVSPDNVASGNPSNAIGYCLAINTDGKRYTDESLGYVNHGKALMNQPGQVCAFVFDENTKQLDKVQQDIKRFAGFNSAPIEADSLEELAGLIGCPADALTATVNEFNAHIVDDHTEGLDVNKAKQAVKVEASKFYAFYPLKPGSIMGFGGLYTNARCEVLEADSTAIARLYVAGEAMGGVFMYDYIAGSSLDRCVVSGLVAADNACA